MKRIFFIILTIIGISWSGYAQESNKNLKFDKSGNVKYIKFDGKNKTGEWDSPTSPETFWKNILNIKEQNEFELKTKIVRKDGSYYEQYRQFYNGIKVEGGIYILHFWNGRMGKANGHYVNVNGLDTSPKLTPEEASKCYANYLHVPDSVPLDFLHGIVIAEIEEVSENDTVYTARLCYKIDLMDSRADNGKTGYVDAQTGKVLKTAKRFSDYSATGTFLTLYSSTQTAGTPAGAHLQCVPEKNNNS